MVHCAGTILLLRLLDHFAALRLEQMLFLIMKCDILQRLQLYTGAQAREDLQNLNILKICHII